MKVTVLVEDRKRLLKPWFVYEHGLSLYIETKHHRILFDTGQSDAFERNAKELGIDLSLVDIAIISHGHYDHGGGLKRFLEINKHAKVYISPHAFEPFYSANGYIGLDVSLKDNDRLEFVTLPITIDELQIFPTSLLPTPYPVEVYGLTVEENGTFVDDDFNHELCLVITTPAPSVTFSNEPVKFLISGCSHKGALNIASFFYPDVFIGGFHLVKLDVENEQDLEKLSDFTQALSKYTLTNYTCHCTGYPQYKAMKTVMKAQRELYYLTIGDVLEF